MVSTRNAAASASLHSPKTGRGPRGAATRAGISDPSRISQSRHNTISGDKNAEKGLRKRGRAASNEETTRPSTLTSEGQRPQTKRAKVQNSPGGNLRRTRGKVLADTQLDSRVPIHAARTISGDSAEPAAGADVSNIASYGQTTKSSAPQVCSGGESTMDNTASLLLQEQSLPVLDNLASQILSVTAKSTYEAIFGMAANPETPSGRAWSTLMTLFNHTKRVYGENAFLSPQRLGIVEEGHTKTIQRANMATFVCSLFGGDDVGFNQLNESYLDVFGVKFFKEQAQLFLDLKTQAYISGVTNDKAAIIKGQRNREGILDDLFPITLDRNLLERRLGADHLTPAELDFVARAHNRRKALLEESSTIAAIDALPDRYIWEDFLRDIRNYITAHIDEIMGATAAARPRPGRPARKLQPPTFEHTPHDRQSQQPQGIGNVSDIQSPSVLQSSNDIAEKAARAAHFAIENYSTSAEKDVQIDGQSADTPSQQQQPKSRSKTKPAPGPPIQFHFENTLHPNVPAPPPPFFTQVPYQNPQMQGQWHPGSGSAGEFRQSYDSQASIPYPTQSAPTHVLYERARMAASAKHSQQQTPRKTPNGTPTQRRPWTSEEENALMAGLDRVKGPHWSQIHAMFGPGGTINEVLKDRSQVQLKDKARNLKLFFLKSNIEIPYYLQFVTGELKTRAPSRVAKNEVREKGISEEDRAHVQGVMTLAGTANVLPEGEQPHVGLQDGGEEQEQTAGGQAVSEASNPNIDPSLGASLQLQNDASTAAYGQRYTVPTPNMIMQSLEKFSIPQYTAQSL